MTALAATVRNLMVILGDYLQVTRIAFGTIYRISTTCLGTTAANNSQNHQYTQNNPKPHNSLLYFIFHAPQEEN